MIDTSRASVDAVCWDWNGTLLDDVEIARTAMNVVLRERGLTQIIDQEAYRRVFGFPIRDFYGRLGIDDHDFVTAATRYLGLFAETIGQAPLHPNARTTLTAVRELGFEQVLISATAEDVLMQQLSPHDLDAYFARILGITDAYAASKAHVVAAWLETSGHDPRRVLMIGDTNHDEEIAEALDVRFLRFRNGHQEPPRHDRHPVIGDLREVISHLSGD